MALWTSDPTFYASPRDAAAAPAEKLAYVAAFDRATERPDAIAVPDVDPGSPRPQVERRHLIVLPDGGASSDSYGHG